MEMFYSRMRKTYLIPEKQRERSRKYLICLRKN